MCSNLTSKLWLTVRLVIIPWMDVERVLDHMATFGEFLSEGQTYQFQEDQESTIWQITEV